MVQINVKMPPDLVNEARQVAELREQRLSQLIRLALREHLKRRHVRSQEVKFRKSEEDTPEPTVIGTGR